MSALRDVDLAIVGSGFGGSILAMIARRLGYRVMLLERGRHPRFAIGESASPLAGILIEQLADRYDLPRIRPLSAYGTWQRTYPHLVCGLKRGFTFYQHEAGQRFQPAAGRTNELLVAASPNDELSDTHWLRSDVDHFLVGEAVALGVEFQDLVDLERIDWQANGDATLVGTRGGGAFQVRANTVIDASGPRGFLSRALGIEDRGYDRFPATQALFSHFTDVARCDELSAHLAPCAPRAPRAPYPYPPDDAALHHVFDGGWMWVLRFGNGIVSAGVALEDWLASELRLAEGEPAWLRLLQRFPSIAEQFADAKPTREFTWMPRLAYRAAVSAGPRWTMLPSAAAFIDPLFSTGIPLTLLGIERLARALEQGIAFSESAEASLEDADVTARFVAGCYAGFSRFEHFVAYSMFYFAAASFTEMARRLDSPRTPRGFLCRDHPAFLASLERWSPARCLEVRADRYQTDSAAAVEAWNVAGLCEPAKQNWYGVDLEDTVRAAAKLGLAAETVRRLTS